MKKWNLPENPLNGLGFLLRNFKWIFIGSVICQIIVIFAGTLRFFLLRYFVDEVLGILVLGEDVPLYLFSLGYILLATLMGVFSLFSARGFSKISENIAREVRNELFDHIQKMSYSYHDKTPTGELIQRVTTDIEMIFQFYGVMLRDLIRISFIFFINLISIFFLNWLLALISLIISPLLLLLSIFAFKRIRKSFIAFRDQGGIVSTVLQENVSGIRVVRAFSRQEFEINKFNKENSEHRRLGIKFFNNHAIFWPTTDILTGSQFLIGILFAGTMTIHGGISIGTFIAYVGMIGSVIWPLKNIGRILSESSAVTVSYNRIREIVREEQEDLKSGISEGKIKGDLQFENASFQYEQGTPVLKDISFSVKKGDKIVLIGEAGSGKTTLINLIPRFYDHYQGKILLDGKPLNEYARFWLRSNIGIVEQDPFLFSTSIRGNLVYGVKRRVSQEEIERVAKAAAIHENIMTFSDGYSTIVGERGVTLSGGQKQRIAIARTLLKNPAIIIFDDSTSSVDTETEQHIQTALENLMKDRTTFIITHRIDEKLSSADLILVFRDGRIIQRGKHQKLINQPGFYRKIFDLQYKIESELVEELRNV
ncbi:MAG: ABC transporter ATP-binding protein [Promethearchaeota archaeon]